MVVNWRRSILMDTTTLFIKYFKKGPDSHAAWKLLHITLEGIHLGGKITVSGYDFNDVEIIHRKGIAKIATSTIVAVTFRVRRIDFLAMISPFSFLLVVNLAAQQLEVD